MEPLFLAAIGAAVVLTAGLVAYLRAHLRWRRDMLQKREARKVIRAEHRLGRVVK